VYLVGLRDLKALQVPQGQAAVTVDVIGHLWWWQVSYPDSHVVTANEIHVPVGQVVHLRLRTADVNHSFWVPQLMPKTDLIAGRTNDTWIKADHAGTFRGQCAEYCGAQHAHMAFLVIAQSPADYASWTTQQAQDAPAPTTPQEARGLQVLETASCASCHTVRGTSAHGTVGPDLTHLATRSQIGAGTLPNDTGHLAGWIANSQTVKPGNKMPPQPLSPDDLRAVVAYLDSGSRP
jgi:cytochrome c oxidase subunit 2